MGLQWLWNFGLDLTATEMSARGWEVVGANVNTTDTNPLALNAPLYGAGGDTRVLTTVTNNYLGTQQYFGMAAGSADRGIFCARVKWVDGVTNQSRDILQLVDPTGTELLRFRATDTNLTAHVLRSTGGTATIDGTRSIAVGETFNLALVYDFTTNPSTYTLYIDGVADITGTRNNTASVGRVQLGSNQGTFSWNTLRFYDDPVADLAEGIATNKWIELLELSSVTQTGWDTVGAPASDLEGLQSDLATGLSTSAARSLDVAFANTALTSPLSIDAVGAFVFGQADGLAGSVEIQDGSGTVGTYANSRTIGAVTYVPVFEADSGGGALDIADVNAMTATLSFA